MGHLDIDSFRGEKINDGTKMGDPLPSGNLTSLYIAIENGHRNSGFSH
jgi:hypothetical protein